METWKSALLRLDSKFRGVKVTLAIDGYTVTYRNEVSNRRVMISTYVNGRIDGAWTLAPNDHPEHRFLRPMTLKPSKTLIGLAARRARLDKMKFDKDEFIAEHTKIYVFNPVWPSSKMVVRHLSGRFKSIELIDRS